MIRYSSQFPKELMRLYASDIGAHDYFSYVSNIVSIEKSLAVLAILEPDFVQRAGCIFWRANADEYDEKKYPMIGMKLDPQKKLVRSDDRQDIERYRNNFAISQFFHQWEDCPDRSVFAVDLSEEDYKLCHFFAEKIRYYWGKALEENFPNRTFEFEIADDLLDEYGVCLTFWQSNPIGYSAGT